MKGNKREILMILIVYSITVMTPTKTKIWQNIKMKFIFAQTE